MKVKVIYCYFPFWFDTENDVMWGFWDFLLPLLSHLPCSTYNDEFVMLQYEGSYFSGLKSYLKVLWS
jgi:hypothetical protein